MPPKADPKGKAKAKAKVKAKAKASRRVSACQDASLGPLLEQEDLEFCKKLFDLSDLNEDGCIGFAEFLQYHALITSHSAGSDLQASGGDDQVEKMFRLHDADNSGGLDSDEFLRYMEAVFTVVGPSNFKQLCKELIERTIQAKAEREGQFDRVFSERLLDQARTANSYKDKMKETALRFIEQKADPNFVDSTGSHMLLYAADKVASDEVFIKKLLDSRADPKIHNKAMECAAFKAAKVRDLDVVQVLLMPESLVEGSDEIEKSERLEFSNKLVANIGSCSPQEARDLLAKKANINHRHENGWTALTAAVFWGRKDCLEVLLATQRTGSGMASTQVRLDVRNAKGRAALHIAARKGRQELIPLLLKARGDPDLQDTDGWTALHHAIFNGKSECVEELIKGSAASLIQGKNGLTPYMVTKLPECAGKLSEKVTKLLEPPETVSYAKGLMPVLKDDKLTPFSKLQALLDLPSVNQSPPNLRMYEQFFDPKTGPNKVRLTKFFEALASPLIQNVNSGWTDLEGPSVNMSAEAARERQGEISQRQDSQLRFLDAWLRETKGLRQTTMYSHDNRGCYVADLKLVVEKELEKFREDFDKLYAKVKDEDGGDDLTELPPVQVINSKGTTQLGVHPFPVWLEELDVGHAFDALRMVNASGMGKDDDDSISAFIDLIANGEDFITGQDFWKNIYKLWLHHYAKLMDAEFQRKIKSLVEKYNAAQQDAKMEASYRSGPVKTYTRMQNKERSLGSPTHETYEGRTVASKILDIVRCSISVQNPAAAVALLNDVFRKLDPRSDKLELMRVVSRFHQTSETLIGYRNIELSLHYNSGMRAGACSRQGKQQQLAMIAEVTIVLEDFANLEKRRQILYDFTKGYYDWSDYDVSRTDSQTHADDEYV